MNNGIELSSIVQQSLNNTTQNNPSVTVNVRNNNTNERKMIIRMILQAILNRTILLLLPMMKEKSNNEIKEDIKYDDQKMDNDISNNGIKISLYNNGYQNEGFYYGKVYIGSNKSKTFNPKPLPTDMLYKIIIKKLCDSPTCAALFCCCISQIILKLFQELLFCFLSLQKKVYFSTDECVILFHIIKRKKYATKFINKYVQLI